MVDSHNQYHNVVKNVEMGILIQGLLLSILPITIIVWIESQTFILKEAITTMVSHAHVEMIDILLILVVLVVIFFALTKFAAYLFATASLIIWIILDFYATCEYCEHAFKSSHVVSRYDYHTKTFKLSCPQCKSYLAQTRPVKDILYGPLPKIGE